ncbi:MAG: hypothetical protein M0Q93_07790 [Terrimicrobiaceae bacterium]|nr:hypothetical protein [Terrimicrobiaceae bacterium]
MVASNEVFIQRKLLNDTGPSAIKAPQFILFVNDPACSWDSYVNYLCKRIRDKWEYPGLPILLRLRGREGQNANAREN